MKRVGVLLLLIFLAFVAWYATIYLAPLVTFAVGSVIIALTGGAIGLVAIFLWSAVERVGQRREARLELRAKRYLIDAQTQHEYAKAEVIIAPAGSQVFVPPGRIMVPVHLEGEMSRWQYHQMIFGKRAGEQPEIVVENPLSLPAPQADIIAVLVDIQRLMILGVSGSGKSSLLRHVVAAKLRAGIKIILIDPHGARPKWGLQIDAVGFGERWEEIIEVFERLEWEHTRRIRLIEQGHPERGFPIVTVVIEELQAIVEYFQNNKTAEFDVGYYIRMFLTRTRKTGIDIIVATQAKGVRATGLEGFSENRDAFLTAKTQGHDGKNHRVLFPGDDGEMVEYAPPPLWPDTRPVGVQPHSILDLPVAPTADERRVVELAAQGASKNEICRQVWGGKNATRYADIETILAKFGGDFSGDEAVISR